MKSRLLMLLLALVVGSGMVVSAKDTGAKGGGAKAAAKTAAKDAPQPSAPAAQYGGIENCKMCHPEIASAWEKTAHAKSFQLLVNVGKEKDPACLPCHSTGYGKGGFVDATTTPGLEGTTCEACHGPGAEHMGDKTKIQRVPSGKVCASCHQDTNIHSIPSAG